MNDVSLLDLWHGELSREEGLQLADPAHPLTIFYGLTESGQPRLVLRTTQKPLEPHLSEAVAVNRYQYGEGWVLSLTLQDPKFDEVFFKLTDDVHARTRHATSETAALISTASVFDEWRRLLRPKPQGQLSTEELRGLVGELWMLLNRFAIDMPLSAAVDGWLGPMGLPQDFHYPTLGYSEVKAIGPSTVQTRISSEYQLDADPLRLLVMTVASASESTPGATSLILLAQEIKSQLDSAGDTSEPFDERLKRLGVDLSDPHYGETWFAIEKVETYMVGDNFPAIRASSLGAGLNNVSYQIDLKSIQDHLENSHRED